MSNFSDSIYNKIITNPSYNFTIPFDVNSNEPVEYNLDKYQMDNISKAFKDPVTNKLNIPDAFYGSAVGNYGEKVYKLTKIGSTYADSDDSIFNICQDPVSEMRFPNTLTTIRSYSFYNASMLSGSLIFPSSLKYIGDYAFRNCTGLNGALVFPEDIVLTEIGSSAFSGCSNLTGDLILPDSLVGNSLQVLWSNAFSNCSGFNGKLKLPNKLKHITSGVFYNCSGLSGELRIPNCVTQIDSAAFSGCTGFTRIVIPDTVKIIQGDAFLNVQHIYYHGTAKDDNNNNWGALAKN